MCLVYLMLPVTLDIPYLVAASVFSSLYLRYLCLFTHSGVQHILCCVFVLLVFVLCTVCCHVILDFPFFVAPSGFSNVYIRPVSCVLDVASYSGFSIFDLPLRVSLTYIFALCLVYLLLPVTLDFPFLIAPSVFSNVYIRPVSCVLDVASYFGYSIISCPFGFL